ncbi:hypothetical protein A5821_002068 [Enterococcus sp. 7F3_DIV0205]|uniref:WxL domain-containing protein n=1 Tax=Candidatus Enterococcus palustris TaxID=1834189 RepID=A0AAQ3Y6D9_9ENTE|nr:hypothetical protein [Enterococcus sp. 7F3_DIV0205]OTN82507.1 hypothetical protein A5821_002418 [Enterococcus sp. 7F3_DIV0205]
MFKKSILLVASLFLGGMALSAANVSVNAEEAQATPQAPQARTLIVTAKGDLTGSLVPYYDKAVIPGLDTGYIDLHYKSHDTGFVDGDNSYLTIELPQEFATIAKQSSFKENISGRVQRKGLLGDRWFTYSPNDILINGTQISFKTPKELWFIHGEVNADISINYGNVQKNYPIRLIKNSAQRYTFKAALRRSMAPWDPIQNPILGTNSSQWASDYFTAYWD